MLFFLGKCFDDVVRRDPKEEAEHSLLRGIMSYPCDDPKGLVSKVLDLLFDLQVKFFETR